MPRIRAALSMALVCLVSFLVPGSSPHAVSTDIVISQVYGGGGNSGAPFNADFIELYNRGSVPVPLAGWSLQYASATGTGNFGASPTQITELPDVTLNPGQYFLVKEAGGATGAALPTPDFVDATPIAMSASAGKVALVVGPTTLGCNGGSTPCSAAQLALIKDLVGYGGANFYEGAAAPLLSNFLAALRNDNGAADTDNNAADFVAAAPNPRNSGVVVPPPPQPTYAEIWAIQGPGGVSPYKDQLIETRGVVTAKKSNGFFIQTVDDGDPLTSNGIFVFTSSTPPPAAEIGNDVNVVGTVSEFVPASALRQPPLTEIVGPSVKLMTSGNPLPEPRELTSSDLAPAGGLDQLERFEGMRVRADLTVVAPTEGRVSEPNATSTSNGVFYAVLEGTGRPMREPGYEPYQLLPPVTPCCLPAFDGNPERIRVDSDALLTSTALNVSTGATISNLTGVLDYGFFSYTILPDPGSPHVVSGGAAVIPAAATTGDEFTVASFNFERFYDDVNDPAIGEPVLNADAYQRRLGKASLFIRTVLGLPDILGAIEVENLSTLEDIAARVNADAGDPNPNYVAYLEEGSDVGGIDVGFLVKSSRVSVPSGEVEQIGYDATYLPPGESTPALLNDRPSLVLRAAVRGHAGAAALPVTVIVNHLRSLNDIDDAIDGARVREKRRLQAEMLAEYIQSLQTASPGERTIAVGDYNAFQFNDAFVDVLGTVTGAPAPATNVLAASADLVDPNLFNVADPPFAQSDRYSYVFDGNAQALDHVLVNAAARERFVRVVHPRANADFPETLRGDETRPERLSDHDAVVAYFTADTTGPTILDFALSSLLLWPPNHRMVDIAASYTTSDPSGGISCSLDVTGNEPQNGLGDGDTDVDWNVLSPTALQLRAERGGVGSGREYVVALTCEDRFGNATTQTLPVAVPRSR